ALTQSDQDSINTAAGGNLLNCTPRDALTITENTSRVSISRNKLIVLKVSTTTSSPPLSPDVTALIEIVKELVLMNKATQQATMKAIEESCVTCGGPHPYYECLATGGNTFDACAVVWTYNQGANPRGDVKAITARSGVAYEGPSIPPTSSSLLKEVEREPKEIRASTDAAIKNQGALIKALEIQIEQMSKVLQERGSRNLPSSTEVKPRVHVKSILTSIKTNTTLIRHIGSTQYTVSASQDKEESYGLKDSDAYLIRIRLHNDALPRKEKDPGSFTLPCYVNNVCFEKDLADLGASVSVMPFD
nr:hypothetical protein [Tanacetum cinerariifolium]